MARNGVDVAFTDHSPEVLDAFDAVIPRMLEMVGIKIERYAKKRCPVGTVESTGIKGYRGGTLRNSITYRVNDFDNSVTVGSNVEYAPYVELGTGPYFETPPTWEKFTSKKGTGIGHGYVHPRPFLKPAIEEHIDEYKRIVENEMKR